MKRRLPEDPTPEKILPGSDEWPAHRLTMESLEHNGTLLIRCDADMGIYAGTWGFKISDPVGENMKIRTLDKEQHLCHLSDLEVVKTDSFKCEWIETAPGTRSLFATVGILRSVPIGRTQSNNNRSRSRKGYRKARKTTKTEQACKQGQLQKENRKVTG